MRVLVLLGFLLLAVASCSSKDTSPGPTGPADSPAIALQNQPGPGTANRSTPAPPTHEGRTASQWAAQLQSPKHATRSRASQALNDLAEEGYPHLITGIKSNSEETRLLCLQALSKEMLVAHQNETMPLLLGLLRDRSPVIRRSAAARLSWYGKDGQTALPRLQDLAEKDEDEEVRIVAAEAIKAINEAVTGRVNLGID